MYGKLYLIPTFLSSSNAGSFLPDDVKSVIKNTTHFAVENIRTSRRFISSLQLDIIIEDLMFYKMDKNFSSHECEALFSVVKQGKNLGLLSEAGLPAIADPGQIAVTFAHQNNIRVIPLPGASSIILGLISSGFNGQRFIFHGYLPIDKQSRAKAIRKMESESSDTTQIFMETPYRNNGLLEMLLATLQPHTKLYIGSDLTGAQEICHSKAVGDWKKNKIDLHKKPTIFAIGK